MSEKYLPYDLKKPSRRKVNEQVCAVFARISEEENAKYISESEDFSEKSTVYAQPCVLYPQKRSLMKIIIPTAAAAAAVAVAVPVAVNAFRNNNAAVGASYSTGEGYSEASPPQSIAESNAASEYAVNDNSGDEPDFSEFDFEARYCRTGGYVAGEEFPKAFWITSVTELNSYCNKNNSIYNFDFPSDDGESFLKVISGYNEVFFETHDLILVVLEESSGSIRHKVTKVQSAELALYNAPSISPTIERLVPETGTDDMALWHIAIELEKSPSSDKIVPVIDGGVPDAYMHEESTDIPSLTEISNMSEIEANNRLKSLYAYELTARWGKSCIKLSGEDGMIWICDSGEITVLFDAEGKVESVRLGEPNDTGEHTEPNRPVPPPFEEIWSMSYDDAKKAIKGFTKSDICKAWGTPDDITVEEKENGFGSVCLWYKDEAKCVGLIFHLNSDEVVDVFLYETRE